MITEQSIREEARLIMLRELENQADGRLNSSLLQACLDSYGIRKARDWVHEELRWLADIGAVTVRDLGSVRIAEITQKGSDHVTKHLVIEGVKRPSRA